MVSLLRAGVIPRPQLDFVWKSSGHSRRPRAASRRGVVGRDGGGGAPLDCLKLAYFSLTHDKHLSCLTII